MFSGLIVGILFGFLLKRSKFCFTGIIRDIYVEKRYSNILLILGVIFTQALIYHTMVYFNIIDKPSFSSYPIIAVIVGSFIYGFGAVMMNGCMTATLVKIGDGRLIGLVSIATFIIASYIGIEGFLKPVTEYFDDSVYAFDLFYKKLSPAVPVIASLVICLVLYVLLYKSSKSKKLKFKMPQMYTGIRHYLCEKTWSKEITAVLIGVLMAIAFYVTSFSGNPTGFAISTPILTWPVACGLPIDLAGG